MTWLHPGEPDYPYDELATCQCGLPDHHEEPCMPAPDLSDPIEDFLEMLPGSLGEDKELTLALYRLVNRERANATASRQAALAAKVAALPPDTILRGVSRPSDWISRATVLALLEEPR